MGSVEVRLPHALPPRGDLLATSAEWHSLLRSLGSSPAPEGSGSHSISDKLRAEGLLPMPVLISDPLPLDLSSSEQLDTKQSLPAMYQLPTPFSAVPEPVGKTLSLDVGQGCTSNSRPFTRAQSSHKAPEDYAAMHAGVKQRLSPSNKTSLQSSDSQLPMDTGEQTSSPSRGRSDDKPKKKVGRPITYKGDINSPHLTEAERRRIKRRIANRESARRVRHKRQESMEEMHHTIQQMRQQNAQLLARLAEVDGQKAFTLNQLATLCNKCNCGAWNAVVNGDCAALQQEVEATRMAQQMRQGMLGASDAYAAAPMGTASIVPAVNNVVTTTATGLSGPQMCPTAPAATVHPGVTVTTTTASALPTLQPPSASAGMTMPMPAHGASKQASIDLDWLLRQPSQDLLSLNDVIEQQ